MIKSIKSAVMRILAIIMFLAALFFILTAIWSAITGYSGLDTETKPIEIICVLAALSVILIGGAILLLVKSKKKKDGLVSADGSVKPGNMKDGLTRANGIVMIAAGGLGALAWPPLILFGFAWTGGPPDFERLVSVPYVVSMSCGLIGAICGLIAGIMIVKAGAVPGKAITVLAIAAAILYLPGIVLLYVMYWYSLTFLVVLLGFAPPVLYLIKTHCGGGKWKKVQINE